MIGITARDVFSLPCQSIILNKGKHTSQRAGIMKLLGNIIWVVFGGLQIALEYLAAGIAMMLTIIGIHFGLQCIKLGLLALWPFGSKIRRAEPQHGCLNTFMNILWFFIGGIWIWLTHILFGIVFCITIIGIPFGKMHFRLARLALSPFGKEV